MNHEVLFIGSIVMVALAVFTGEKSLGSVGIGLGWIALSIAINKP